MPSRDVARLMHTITMPDGRRFVDVAAEFCQLHQGMDADEFKVAFHDKFEEQLNTVKRRLDMPDVTLSRILGLITTTLSNGLAGQ